MLRLSLCGTLALGAGGCSISMPMAGFVDDSLATGSIARPDALIFRSLDQEDGRRARAALAVALDPQGNGESVAWGNPQSGAKGSFVATAMPFTEGARVCRAFGARVEPDARTDRAVEGKACRNAEGEWQVSQASESKDVKSAADMKDAAGAKGARDATAVKGDRDAKATRDAGGRPG